MTAINTTPAEVGAISQEVVPCYATVDDFVNYILCLAPSPDGLFDIKPYDAYIMTLLNRWYSEAELSETDTDIIRKDLAEINEDLIIINEELGDADRGAVIRQLGEWAKGGEGWLTEHINKLRNTITACKV